MFKHIFYKGGYMEKNIEENYNHIINIIERKTITLTGIKKINNFDENEFFLESTMGQLIIKGEKLELLKMDTFKGNLNIKGRIISINYLEENKKLKADNIMARLFK
jgi:sporulation protein YabP